uniref:hypothetical protein n=1 Tax=Inonotus hispidus TaxID=40469 RepID=UPI0021824DAF|nr:hypothetical protein N4M07_mgp036 [Inonotus hispidus]UVF38016.1 hypothetical protein [Inonotus hispidus]
MKTKYMRRNNNQASILSNLSNLSMNYRRPSPFFILARMILVPVARMLGLPNSLQPVIFGLWSVISTFVTVYGIYPTLAGIWALRQAIRHDHPIEFIAQHAPLVGRALVEELGPIWRDLIGSRVALVKYLTTVACSILFYALRPITFALLRWSFTLICSALGIFWSETLRGVEFLFNFAQSIKNFFKFAIGFELPLPKELIDTPAKKTSTILLGIVFLTLSLIGIDLYFHNLIENIPYIETIVAYCYTLYRPMTATYRIIARIINFFRSGGGGTPAGPPPVNPPAYPGGGGLQFEPLALGF